MALHMIWCSQTLRISVSPLVQPKGDHDQVPGSQQYHDGSISEFYWWVPCWINKSPSSQFVSGVTCAGCGQSCIKGQHAFNISTNLSSKGGEKLPTSWDWTMPICLCLSVFSIKAPCLGGTHPWELSHHLQVQEFDYWIHQPDQMYQMENDSGLLHCRSTCGNCCR